MPELNQGSPTRVSRLLLLLGLAGLAASGLWAQPNIDVPLGVTGTLVDERGVAAAGVEVVLRPYPSDYEIDLDLLGYDALPPAVDRGQSGLDGSFSLRAPVPGPYRLEIRTAPPVASPDAVVPLVYGDLVPLEAPRVLEPNELPNRRLVAARVLDADGRPIKGALVVAIPTRSRSARQERSASGEERKRLHTRFQRASARTDAQGVARFLMPTADANVVVSAKGFGVETGATESGRATFVLTPDPGIRFRVRGPDGAPAPGVLLRTTGNARAPLALTDEQGDVTAGKVAGTGIAFELLGWDNAFARVSQPDAAASAPAAFERIVDSRLEPPLRIPGRVIDRVSGSPVENAAIWVVGAPGENALSAPTGEFLLESRPRRESRRLWVQAEGYVATGVSALVPEDGVTNETAVALRPAAPLYGFVTDPAGQPVAGADISARPRTTDSITGMIAIWPPDATSADNGSFRMSGIVYGNPYRLTIRAAGFPSSAIELPPYEPGAAASPVRIRLANGRQARGRVVDTDGNPVTGAEVKLTWPEEKQSRFASLLREDATEAVATNEQGAFRIAAVNTGEYNVNVSHSEHVSPGALPVEVPEGRGEIDLGEFTLVPGAEILGVVVGPEREPVEGASIRFRSYSWARDQERTATTDADGNFRLAGLPHEQVDLTVEAEGYALSTLQGARPATGEPILIQLARGASLSGRVLTAAGTAAVGARVNLEPDDSTRMRVRDWYLRDTRTRTDGDGRFSFGHVIPGLWFVEASAGSEAARSDRLEFVSGSERTVELRLHAQDRLTVIVTASSGQPVTEARIRLEPKDAGQSSEYGTTDGSGRARLDVTAGPATLTVQHPEHPDDTREIVVGPGNTEMAVQLQAGGEINGFVRFANGAPASATVEAHPEEAANTAIYLRKYVHPPTTTVSGSDGSFHLTGLEAGRYFLVARAAGHAESGPAEPIDVDGGGAAGVEIVLESGASLRGAVTGLPPADLAQVTITATRLAQWQSATPDTEGNFTMENLAPGTWQVFARRGDSFTARSVERAVTIEAAGAEEFVELPFERGLRLTGQVLAAGEPLVGVHLRAQHLGRERAAHAEVDQEGRFELEGLEAGSYRLAVSSPSGGTEYRSIELQTDLDGLRIDLQPEAILSGIVLDATTDLPLRDVYLTAGDAAGMAAVARAGDDQAVYRSARIAGHDFSADAGRFEIHLGPGAERLWVTSDGYQGALIPLNIAPGQRQEGLVIRLHPEQRVEP
ncbi:MAG: carboxypeptidase regulatory-like domain-containing protein [Acidobacteriota bacterium]|nr:carboxypeptidase regulatory-like domain-containing protein [Acidobacteriota bacterium]